VSPLALPVHGLGQLRSVLLRKDMLRVVREAFVRHAEGEVVAPRGGELLFQDPPGDCHIKFGHFRDGQVFVVKVAMGFYENAAKGLETNNGLMLVFDARTGATLAVLNDQGWLTSWRTAAAGALAAKAGAPSRVSALGIVGSGHQAEHQARWTAEMLGVQRVFIWGRSAEKAARLAASLSHQGLIAQAVSSVEQLFERCNVVMTCTPSTSALVPAAVVRPGTHIVALGADSLSKQELDPAILARARVIMTDDRHQCAERGELAHALAAGLVEAGVDVSLGQVLAGKLPGRFSDDDVTVADLTGLAAHDIAIASLAVESLRNSER